MDGASMRTLGGDEARSRLAGLDGAGGQAGGAERAGDGNHCELTGRNERRWIGDGMELQWMQVWLRRTGGGAEKSARKRRSYR